MDRKNIGNYFENICKNYLEKNGYNIIDMNYHSRYGEIDVIARKDKDLVFVEVKARKMGSLVKPVEAVDKKKMVKIIKTAYHFLSNNQSLESFEFQPRFDVFEIYFTYDTEGRDQKVREKVVNHIENAFDLSSIDFEIVF